MNLPIKTICLIAALMASAGDGLADQKTRLEKKQAWTVSLTDQGKILEAKYTKELDALRAQIRQALPVLPAQKKESLTKAMEAERAALLAKYPIQTQLLTYRRKLTKPERVAQKIEERKRFQAYLKTKLSRPGVEKSEPADYVAELRRKLSRVEKNLRNSESEINKAKKESAQARANEPKQAKKLEQAEQALIDAHAVGAKAYADCGLAAVLASNKLDGRLAKYIVMSEASPRLLAGFAQQGPKQQALVRTLLTDPGLMLQMAVADGPKYKLYAKAMEIYTAILKTNPKAREGVLQRLALAVSLTHAFPIKQKNPKSQPDAPEFVDPLGRYRSYQSAYLNNQLDPTFAKQSVWNLKMVVDGYEPDECIAWGRQMLHHYRPDHISNEDYRWRYVMMVASDIVYTSKGHKMDRPELHYFQNILMDGGICGRRAFFGRFILRAFGIPTTARPQKGHGALTHWTPDGWVICLGSDWGAGHTNTRYRNDLDFLSNTQARENARDYLQVKRAQWIGDVVGEEPVYGLIAGNPEFWYAASLFTQQEIINKSQAKTLEAVGEDLAEANESSEREAVAPVTIKPADRQIRIDANGSINIPAASCSHPKNNTEKIKFIRSDGGGLQLHYERRGRIPETFAYDINVNKAGKYALKARVATPSDHQYLSLHVNGASQPVSIPLPFTLGMWGTTQPVEIELRKGRNSLTFTREHPYLRGVSIKEFRVTPLQ